MASRCYSVRFMIGRGGNRAETFTVPEGRRAVVRHIHVVGWGLEPVDVYLQVHGIFLISTRVTGPQIPIDLELRETAYERETIEVLIDGPDASYSVNGFLYEDPDGTPDDADNEISAPLVGRPLPAAVPELPAG